MTEREALKLARQLLWRYRHETPMGDQPHMICQEVDEAFERIDEALAQPEQEPVAWMDSDGNISDNNDHKCFPIPLYTTPPQRKPLTDEQLTNIITTLCNTDDGTCDTRVMCRAIEAAHGIKGHA